MTPFRTGVVLRCLNLGLCLLWLYSLRSGGLLVSLTAPFAVVGVWLLANASLASFFEGMDAKRSLALLAGDLVLLTWSALWTRAPVSSASLFFLTPMLVAALTAPVPAAAAFAAAALAAALAAARLGGGIRPSLWPPLSVLALAAAAGLLLARREGGEKQGDASRLAVARSMLFTEFLNHVLFQTREYLTSITTVTEHLAISAKEPGVRDMGKRLEKMIAELNGKVGRMLDTMQVQNTTRSKRSSRRRLEFEVEVLLKQCLDAVRQAYPAAHAETRIVCDKDIGRIQGDWDMLHAVVCAALCNSYESMLHHGAKCRIMIAARKKGDAVELDVMDDAGGVPSDDLAKAFQPLFTTRANLGHIGLGLSMSRRMLERSGGTMLLKSASGKTTVRLQIPLVPSLPVVREAESTWANRRKNI